MLRRRSKHWLWLLLLPVLLAPVGYRLYLGWRLDAKVDAIRARGEPATPAELEATVDRPAKPTPAEKLYRSAFTQLSSATERRAAEWNIRSPGEPIGEKLAAAMRKHLENNAGVLKKLRKARGHGGVVFASPLQRGIYRTIPDAGGLLAMEAVCRAKEGNLARATTALRSGFALAAALRQEPGTVLQYLRLSVQEQCLAALERVLTTCRLDGRQRDALLTALREAEAPKALHRAMLSVRCDAVQRLQRSRKSEISLLTGHSPSAIRKWKATLYSVSGLVDREGVRILDLLGRWVRISKLPPEKWNQAMQRLTKKIPPETGSRARKLLWNHLTTGVTYVRSHLKSIAHLRAARAALRIEAIREKKGRLPSEAEGLESALAAAPVDPVTSKPLRFRRTEGGYAVYSVGVDGKDDNGRGTYLGEPRNRDDSHDDVAFTVATERKAE